ncbi:MAG: 5'/3'-nucleotidase SurE [Bacteroidota bacterium]
MSKPLILISNDDGITSKGISKLVHAAKNFGEVVVVAPDSPQSGMGHAITVGDSLRLRESDIFGDVEAYECSGTPADCVKLGKHFVLKERKIDLVLSGVNHGSNSAINVLYSGTMSAAIEGAVEGLPAIGFSYCDYDPNAEMSHIDEYLALIIKQALEKDFQRGIALNVNFPVKQQEKIKGIKFCRQADATWEENFDERTDPYGRKYFWMVGNFVNRDKGEDNDEWALANNYISIVPCQFDMTGHHAISSLNRDWSLNL